LTQRLAWDISQNSFLKAYLKVSYGKKLDIYNKMTEFINEGYYDKKKDLRQAFRAFIQEE